MKLNQILNEMADDDDDLDWGDDLIEDINLLLSEVDRLDGERGFEELKRGLIDLISQYDRKEDV